MGFVSSRIQEAILIHRDGTFLGRYPLVSRSPVEWAAQARALLDMMNAVGASFSARPEGLQDLEFEGVTLHLDIGGRLILVSVVEGRVRPALARRLRQFLEDLEVEYHATLATWAGRPEGFDDLDRILRHLVEG